MTAVQTAAQVGVIECPHCTAIFRRSQAGLRCTRCGALLHWRKPHSLRRTWAFLLAAMALYLPANLLPVMTTG
uniref:paraquat-inducible protein A n=1 Tax=uncultured Pigmentiphaga sp. TaxID=340361 RepID=UPI00262648E2